MTWLDTEIGIRMAEPRKTSALDFPKMSAGKYGGGERAFLSVVARNNRFYSGQDHHGGLLPTTPTTTLSSFRQDFLLVALDNVLVGTASIYRRL